MDFLAYLQGKRAERETWGVHAGGGATMIRRVEAERRRELEAKALMCRPRNGTVSEDVIEVIRLVLLAGVRAHGDGGVVRGVVSGRDLTTAGGVLVRFLPSVCALGGELGDLEACFGRDLIRWWSAPGGFCKEGMDSRDKAVLMWARSWVSEDPIATWLDDKLHPDPPRVRRVRGAAGGYTASELTQVFSWCEQQNTQRRRDVCAAVVALCFGAGLSAAELRLVDAGHVAADGSSVTVGDEILPVRAEVRSALVDLQDRNALLTAVRNPLSLVPHPASCRIQARKLQEAWGVAELAEGRSLQSVMQRIPRSTALRAVKAAPDFGPWPAGVELNAGAVRAAPLGDLVMGAETSFSPSLQVIQGGRL